MKNNTLLLLGAGILAYFLLKGNKAESTGTGDSTPFFQYVGTGEPILNKITGTSFSTPVLDVMKNTLNLSQVDVLSPSRFTGVTYDKGKTVGVLDRAMQQSITVEEAQKRATNPFIAAVQPLNMQKGWQNSLKNYNKNVLGV